MSNTSPTKKAGMKDLTHNLQGGATLNSVTSVLRLNHNASLRRIGRASSAVDEETRATAHTVGTGGIQLVAIRHTLESHHVSKSVSSLRKRSDRHLALTRRVVAARAGLTAAASSGVNVGSVEGSSIKVVTSLRISVRPTSGRI
jgi:hypothetical protein